MKLTFYEGASTVLVEIQSDVVPRVGDRVERIGREDTRARYVGSGMVSRARARQEPGAVWQAQVR